jgi:hypothetical protein
LHPRFLKAPERRYAGPSKREPDPGTQDEHTRAAIVRGGSAYQPQGSIWYFPQAYRNDQHSKLLLMSPGRDRSGSIGFRCVADAQ